MIQTCNQCRSPFEIYAEDLAFLEKVSPVIAEQKFNIPPPKNCPACREQLRMAFRNERHLFPRECSATKDKLISCHEPNTPFPVIKNALWWADSNDAKKFKLPVDFSRPLLAQLSELQRITPRTHTYTYAEDRLINSLYTNCSGDLKDCYLIFAAGRNERCYYSIYLTDCFNSMDCFFAFRLTNCYECTDCETCHSVFFSQASKNCNESYFLYDCRGCTNCIACVGLRQKEFHILNQPVSKAVFEQTLRSLHTGNRQALRDIEIKFQQLLASMPRRFIHGDNLENCSGDYLWHSKNCFHCFDTNNAQDCRYCTWYDSGKDTMDQFSWGESELCYQIVSGGQDLYHCLFCCASFGCRDSYYLDHCHYCKDCIACVGLKNEQYCILNQQYSKTEYLELAPKVLSHMMRTGEWGEFFPPSMSSFAYNYSVAIDYYPLTRAEALSRGFIWSDLKLPSPAVARTLAATELPQALTEVSADILESAIICEATGRPFRIIKEELDFYLSNKLPLPLNHPDQRYLERLAFRNPRRLWKRACDNCSKQFETSYSPERPEKIYCNECYLAEIH